MLGFCNQYDNKPVKLQDNEGLGKGNENVEDSLFGLGLRPAGLIDFSAG